MKAIHVLFDDDLLTELDETAEVREKGRSAVLRQLTSDFLRQRREQEVDAQYERAYAGVEDPLGKDFKGWESEGERLSRQPRSFWRSYQEFRQKFGALEVETQDAFADVRDPSPGRDFSW